MSLWRAHGALMGLAVGDALGAPLEFSTPQKARAAVENGAEMSGGGPWAPGEWTDDTAMALCLAESIAEHGLLETDDVARRYIGWAESGPKDIGNTTRAALWGSVDARQCRERARVLHEHTGRTAGNGTVMRCAPIALAAPDREAAVNAALADAALTHFDPAAGLASAALCIALIAIDDYEQPITPSEAAQRTAGGADQGLEQALRAAVHGDEGALASLAQRDLGVCWTALAIGLYAVESFADYESGVQWAISLGGDTDTNAAVAGALLGCRDGVGGIPERWRNALIDEDRIEWAVAGLSESGGRSGRSVRLPAAAWPGDAQELGEIHVRPGDLRSAVALSRGREPKSYGYADPNEDFAAAYVGTRATLLALADGHNGEESTYAAGRHVLERFEKDPPPRVTDADLVDLFHGAGEAVLKRTTRPDCTNPESRTTLIVCFLAHRELQWAALGDSGLMIVSANGGRRLDAPRSHFVGYPMTRDEVAERLQRGSERLEAGEWVILASDGFIDFVTGDPVDAVAEVIAATGADPCEVAHALVERTFEGGAGDNVAVAAAVPFDAPLRSRYTRPVPDRRFPG